MKWIEIIELRSAAGTDFPENIDLEALVTEMPEGYRPDRIVFFQHGTVKSDVSIHLNFNMDTVFRRGSKSGLWLKEMLQPSGLVSHKIWVETAGFQIPGGDDDA